MQPVNWQNDNAKNTNKMVRSKRLFAIRNDTFPQECLYGEACPGKAELLSFKSSFSDFIILVFAIFAN